MSATNATSKFRSMLIPATGLRPASFRQDRSPLGRCVRLRMGLDSKAKGSERQAPPYGYGAACFFPMNASSCSPEALRSSPLVLIGCPTATCYKTNEPRAPETGALNLPEPAEIQPASGANVIAALSIDGVFGLVWSGRTSAGSGVGFGIRVAEHVDTSREAP